MLTDEQIFEILDGCADAELLQQHAHLLSDSLAYQQYFNELATLHADLATMPLDKPSAKFTQNVLAAIPAGNPVFVFARKKEWGKKLTYIFVGAMITVLLGAAVFALLYQPSSETGVEEPNLISESLNGFLTNYFTNIALLLNMIVMLIIFDRRILRPYFKQRSIRLG